MAFVGGLTRLEVSRSDGRSQTCSTRGVKRGQVVAMAKGKNSKYRQKPMRQQQGGPELPPDGTPVFTVVVRSKEGAQIWYPCGGVKGDDRAKTLVGGLETRMGKWFYISALDRGIAQTIFRDSAKFESNALQMYPALKEHRGNLEFGYRVSAVGMETTKTRVVNQIMAMPLLQWLGAKIQGKV